VSAALRQRVPLAPDVAPEIAGFDALLPYATSPVDVTCRQGSHSYVAKQVALRDGHILFIDPCTGQFGIARLDAAGGRDARQYPMPSIAVLMFLGPREAMDE